MGRQDFPACQVTPSMTHWQVPPVIQVLKRPASKKASAPQKRLSLSVSAPIQRRQQLRAEVGSLAEASAAVKARSKYNANAGRGFARLRMWWRTAAWGLKKLMQPCKPCWRKCSTTTRASLKRSTWLNAMAEVTRQSLQGWRKLDPPKSRLPLPLKVVCVLPTAGGGATASGEGSGPTSGVSPVLVSDPSSDGGARAVKEGQVRRAVRSRPVLVHSGATQPVTEVAVEVKPCSR